MRRAWSFAFALTLADAAQAAEPPPDVGIVTLRLGETAEAATTLAAAAALPGVRPLAVGALPGGGGLIDLSAPAATWAELAALPGVVHVGAPWRPSAKAVVSEGRATLDLSTWDEAGLTGRGITVAVVDVGFSGWDSAPEELPPDQVELVYGEAGGDPHGAAVAEVILDVAPEVTLRLYRVTSAAEFIEALGLAEEDGVDLVCGSLGFDNVWHADGASPMSQAVDRLNDAGVAYVAAAGNEVGRYAAGLLHDADGDGWLTLGEAERVYLNDDGGRASVSLRWDEPFGAAAVDLALHVEDGGVACDVGDEAQRGAGDPTEAASCVGVSLASARVRWVGGGSAEGLMAWIYSPGGVGGVTLATAGTLTLPADARGALSVGALPLGDDSPAAYSSQGPTDDGRLKPELVGPSGVSTRSAPFFDGSSAATPHVAGLVALWMDRARRDGPDEITDGLLLRAADLGEPGPDPVSGHGAARAGDLPARCGCAAPTTRAAPPWTLILAVFVGLRRRTTCALAVRSAIV
ncbi:S8 family serine peptidase [Myxococcota bacterium]|nr:S8 family serine peptidase [Myxococcota bacterium]